MNPQFYFDKQKYYDSLFLDRDGVINVLRKNDYVKTYKEFEFRSEFLESIKELSNSFKRVIVITNQRGVGKGLMSEEALKDIHSKMVADINRIGGRIDAIYYCIAIEDSHPCRKPNTGMFKQILGDFPDIDVSHSLMFGDSISDEIFANRIGVNFIKI